MAPVYFLDPGLRLFLKKSFTFFRLLSQDGDAMAGGLVQVFKPYQVSLEFKEDEN
jgi:hypothetical protein